MGVAFGRRPFAAVHRRLSEKHEHMADNMADKEERQRRLEKARLQLVGTLDALRAGTLSEKQPTL